jgi:hypothetical protein
LRAVRLCDACAATVQREDDLERVLPEMSAFPALISKRIPIATAAAAAVSASADASDSKSPAKADSKAAAADLTGPVSAADAFIAEQLIRMCSHVDVADEGARRILSDLMRTDSARPSTAIGIVSDWFSPLCVCVCMRVRIGLFSASAAERVSAD